jgi:hypothetical protein
MILTDTFIFERFCALELRSVFISLLLGAVLSIGVPLEPFLSWSNRLQPWLEFLGIDVSMTPITYDMTMGNGFEKKKIDLIVKMANGDQHVINVSRLNLYKVKLPVLLLLELYEYGVDAPELRGFVCHSLSFDLGEKVQSSHLTADSEAIMHWRCP